MGQIIVSTNVSLDGVVQDPDGKEGFRHGGWFVQSGGSDLAEWAAFEQAEAERTSALLLGRHSDAWFAARWPDSRPGGWAERLRSLPKYVVSATLEEPIWSNATVLSGDVVDEVTTLKHEIDGDIVVYGSRQLVGTLIEHDLVDQVRLIVFPIVLGSGDRLFAETTDSKALRLTESGTIGVGLTYVVYELIHDAAP